MALIADSSDISALPNRADDAHRASIVAASRRGDLVVRALEGYGGCDRMAAETGMAARPISLADRLARSSVTCACSVTPHSARAIEPSHRIVETCWW